MALLGGNGAGKTTVFNMIRGELKPDFGNIHLDGVTVLHQPRKAIIQIGVCPQNDAVDSLNVRQTLEFYAAVKGLKNVRANIDQVLGLLDTKSFANSASKALSGGTKRKLTVGIALLGKIRPNLPRSHY
jgi:ATP-binding cassette subfamily A (ABC1) protein 3